MINTNNNISEFSEIDLDLFLRFQKTRGRKDIAQSKVKNMVTLNSRAQEILRDKEYGFDDKKTADFVSIITDTITQLSQGEASKYNTYIELKLLEWYLNDVEDNSRQKDEKILGGLYFMAMDFLQFEVDTFENKENYFQKQVDNIDLQKRIELLKDLVETINKTSSEILGFEFNSDYKSNKIRSLVDFAMEENRINGLVEFSCFPRTEYHDEYAFIRTIHISEFCFIQLKDLLKKIIDGISNNDQENLKNIIHQACSYVDILLGVTKVLRTMPFKPVNNFMFFREDTGNASAIQSVSYQEYEILLYGIRKSKREVYEKIPALNHLLVYENEKSGYNLKSIIKANNIEETSELYSLLKRFDTKFLKWKAIHLGFALSFLPKFTGGTGSTEGAPYLERIFKASIFS